jgi:hypothetical protein
MPAFDAAIYATDISTVHAAIHAAHGPTIHAAF